MAEEASAYRAAGAPAYTFEPFFGGSGVLGLVFRFELESQGSKHSHSLRLFDPTNHTYYTYIYGFWTVLNLA